MLQTPYRETKRIPLRQLDQIRNSLSPRVLSQTFSRRSKKAKEKWTDAELKALTEFVLFHSGGDAWPAHKWMSFGEELVNLCKLDQAKQHAELVGVIFVYFMSSYLNSTSLLVSSNWELVQKVQDVERCRSSVLWTRCYCLCANDICESAQLCPLLLIKIMKIHPHFLMCSASYQRILSCKHCLGFSILTWYLLMICKFQMISCATQQMQCCSLDKINAKCSVQLSKRNGDAMGR